LSKEAGQLKQLAEVFSAPMLYHPGGWEDSLPQDLKQQVIIERLLLVAKGEWDRATDAEVICYLYTASLARPLGGDWTDIYTYMMAQWKPQLRDAVEVPQELSRWQWTQLQGLKCRMRERQKRRKKPKSATFS